jgi:hypothetical protein
LAYCLHGARLNDAVRLGDFKDVVSVMSSHVASAAVQVLACLALGAMIVVDGDKDRAVAAGVLQAAVRAMQGHPARANVQEAALCALSILCRGGANCMQAVKAGAVQEIEKAIETHADNAAVLWRASQVITDLAACTLIDTINQLSVRADAASVFDALAAALPRHVAHPDAQQFGCRALACLVRVQPDEWQNRYAAANAIAIVLAAMQAHAGHHGVLLSACSALQMLCSGCLAACSHAVAGGAVELVVAALQSHPGNEQLQAHGCAALTQLVTAPEARMRPGAKDAVSAVVAAGHAGSFHPSSPTSGLPRAVQPVP